MLAKSQRTREQVPFMNLSDPFGSSIVVLVVQCGMTPPTTILSLANQSNMHNICQLWPLAVSFQAFVSFKHVSTVPLEITHEPISQTRGRATQDETTISDIAEQALKAFLSKKT